MERHCDSEDDKSWSNFNCSNLPEHSSSSRRSSRTYHFDVEESHVDRLRFPILRRLWSQMARKIFSRRRASYVLLVCLFILVRSPLVSCRYETFQIDDLRVSFVLPNPPRLNATNHNPVLLLAKNVKRGVPVG